MTRSKSSNSLEPVPNIIVANTSSSSTTLATSSSTSLEDFAVKGVNQDFTEHFRQLFASASPQQAHFDVDHVLSAMANLQEQWLPIVKNKRIKLAKYSAKRMTTDQKAKVEAFWAAIEPQAFRTIGEPLGQLVLRQNLVVDEAIRLSASQPTSQAAHVTANDKVKELCFVCF